MDKNPRIIVGVESQVLIAEHDRARIWRVKPLIENCILNGSFEMIYNFDRLRIDEKQNKAKNLHNNSES